MFRGLGGGEPVAAILSNNIKMQVNGLIAQNEFIYVIFIDLSRNIGTTFHDIIGYDLLRDFAVEINYKTRK
jgi:hypothetical protein